MFRLSWPFGLLEMKGFGTINAVARFKRMDSALVYIRCTRMVLLVVVIMVFILWEQMVLISAFKGIPSSFLVEKT